VTSYLFTFVLSGNDKKITPISAQEKLKALEILQGIFLLHPISKEVVVENNGIKVGYFLLVKNKFTIIGSF
jgi:hypothetical protein